MKKFWKENNNKTSGYWEAVDGQVESDVGYCSFLMNGWKKDYCRKNSRQPVRFELRLVHTNPNPDLWVMYIELSFKNKLQSQHRITVEAYDLLAGKLPVKSYMGINFITIFSFTPTVVEKQISAPTPKNLKIKQPDNSKNLLDLI